MLQQSVLIVAGGIGERSGKNIPKQFVELNNKPIIIHSAENFFYYDSDILMIIVCHPDFLNTCKKLFQSYLPEKSIHFTTGGETRFHSVKNGMEYLKQINFQGIVAVHDAARPCVSTTLIKKCFETAQLKGNAIPAIPLNESIRKITGDKNTIAYREEYKIIQTPQCADFSVLYNAFQQNYQNIFTDEANVLESYGKELFLEEGEKTNIKITYSIDFYLAEKILSTQNY